MRTLRAWWMRVRGLFGKADQDREFAAEMQSHLEMHVEDNLRSGMSSAEARRRALIQLGGLESLTESYRERRGVPWIEHLGQDLRYGVRILFKSPGFTAVALLALALGIGANTALFSVVYGVLLRPLPYTDGNHLVEVQQQARAMSDGDMLFSVMEINDYRAQSRTLDDLEEYHSMQFILLGRQPDRVQTGVVSAGFFPMLGVKPLLGRVFRPSDDQIGAPPVLVLSYTYWQRAFGGDPKIVGQTFKMNDRMHTVVGVLPPIPQYPRENDVYMPVSACPFRSGEHAMSHRDMHMMRLFGHLRPGVTLTAAKAEMHGIAGGFQRDYPSFYPKSINFDADVASLRDQLTNRARPMLLLLLGTTGLVLLICCTNVANLALARIVHREHEFAVRAALGASRRRLVRQLLTESTLLALAGGAAGLLLSSFAVDVLVRFTSLFTTRAMEVTLNTPVLLFALGLSLLTGLAFGSLPALAAGRGMSSLKLGSSTTTVKVHGHRLRSSLIVAEVTLSFVMLTAAGLMIRTLVKLQRLDAGYDGEHVVSMQLPFNWSKYNNPDKTRTYEDALLQRISNVPGVTSAGLVSAVPLLGGAQPSNVSLYVEGRAVDPSRPMSVVDVEQMSPGAFQTLGIPLLHGRVIDAGDRPEKLKVAVISQSLAKHYWGNEDPIGKRISADQKDWFTIVGVVGDVRQFGLDHSLVDTAYVSLAQQPGAGMLAVRALGDPMSVVSAVRKAVAEVDPEQPVTGVKTLEELRDDSIVQQRVTTMLLALFAVLALIIAATGLAGVTSFLVSQRTREIGIRLALGAQVRQIVVMVLSHGTRLLLLGLGLGLVASYVVGRALQTLLFEIRPVDGPTLAIVTLVLVGASLGASYMPARRATRVDPMIALRSE